jgi:trehalose 6-phosphate synthase
MRALRKRVRDYDVARWSTAFLSALTDPNGVPSYVATKWGASDR